MKIEEIIRSIVCIPFLPFVFFAGVLLDDIEGILDFYYPLFRN